MKRAHILLVAALVAACGAAAPVVRADGIYINPYSFAAITYSPSTGEFHYAYNYGDRWSAEQAALNVCEAKDARIVCWVNEGFAALAVGDDKSTWGIGYEFGGGAETAVAKSTAIDECNKRTTNAHVVLCISSDGQYIYKPKESPKGTGDKPSEKPEEQPSAKPIDKAPPPAGRLQTITNDTGMKLVLIPAGEFTMGNRESADDTATFFSTTYGAEHRAESFKDQHPQHRVRITRPFYLGVYHVTRGQFRQFVADADYKTDAEKGAKPGAYGWDQDEKKYTFDAKYSWRNVGFEQTDEHPVLNVTWNDAVAFCQWLSRKEGKTYRLPTEAEWEYACRAGTTTRYWCGDDPETLAQVANVADATAKAQYPSWKCALKASDGYVFTAPVRSFRPNAFGLFDMHGNAWQWCADWYGTEYYATSPADDPAGPDSGESRVLRGGAWDCWPVGALSANRFKLGPDVRYSMAGFRVARAD
jgi:formylglycine-generating enzyme